MKKSKVKKSLEAEELRLVDSKGQLRALLSASDSWGNPMLSLFDKQGLERLILQLDDGFPSVALLCPTATPLIGIGIIDDAVRVTICRKDGTPAVLCIAEDGKQVKVALCDANGESVWQVPEQP